MSERLEQARQRAEERRRRRRSQLLPVGWIVGAAVWVAAFGGHPRPGGHGTGGWVLAVLVVYTVALALAIGPAVRASVAARIALDVLLGAAGVALVGLQAQNATSLAPAAAVFIAAGQLPHAPAAVVAVGITSRTPAMRGPRPPRSPSAAASPPTCTTSSPTRSRGRRCSCRAPGG